jgi:hypothetical protein
MQLITVFIELLVLIIQLIAVIMQLLSAFSYEKIQLDTQNDNKPYMERNGQL